MSDPLCLPRPLDRGVECHKVRFLLVTPRSTSELEKLAGSLPVYVDRGHIRSEPRGEAGFHRVSFDRGAMALRLEWPFEEAKLWESLLRLLALQVPDPRALLGKNPPDFVAKNLAGETILLGSLSKPLLLVFFNPACPSCWEDLPILVELSKEANIVLLAVGEISTEERERFKVKAEERITVLFTKEIRILEACRVMRSPTYFLLDKKEVAVWVWEGNVVPGTVEKVREVLKKAGKED